MSELLSLSNFKVIESVFANPRMPRDAYAKGYLGELKYAVTRSLYKCIGNSFLKSKEETLLFRAQKTGYPILAEPEFLYCDAAGTRYNWCYEYRYRYKDGNSLYRSSVDRL